MIADHGRGVLNFDSNWEFKPRATSSTVQVVADVQPVAMAELKLEGLPPLITSRTLVILNCEVSFDSRNAAASAPFVNVVRK